MRDLESMRLKLPFPYWLWEEIVLTKPPHNRLTLFRFITVCMAFGGAAFGFFLGRRFAGSIVGVAAACALFFPAALASYCVFRWSEAVLRALVRWGFVAEPEFEEHLPGPR
jgi:hypothetical protein